MFQSRHARRVRARMVAEADFLTHHLRELGYLMSRPMRSFGIPYGHVPQHPMDCSEACSVVAHAAGAPTPWVYKDSAGWQGYTGTMLDKLRHVWKTRTRRGDFAVFCTVAEPRGAHVVMFLQGGAWHRDPLVWSHGRPGVDVMPLSQMQAGFPGSHTIYLRSVPLRLRAPKA